MAINKIVYAGETLLDLTGDTVSQSTLLSGATAHDKSGTKITGTCTFDVDSGDATAVVAEILDGKTAYARGSKIEGTMPNRGSQKSSISTLDQQITIQNGYHITIQNGYHITIQNGYHDGSGKVQIDSVEKAKLIPSNIKQGVEILGITGILEPSSSVTVQAKSFTPTKTGGTVLPDAGCDYLTQVTIAAIPYQTSENSAGGTTVTIA